MAPQIATSQAAVGRFAKASLAPLPPHLSLAGRTATKIHLGAALVSMQR
jgi:hypothetical protein